MSWENDWVELKNGFHVRKSRVDAFAHDFTGDGSVVYLASGATIEIHESPLELQKLLTGSENAETLKEDQIFNDYYAKEAARRQHLSCSKCFGKGWISDKWGNETCTRCVGSGVDNR